MNYIGPNDSQGTRLFIDGVQVASETTKFSESRSAGDGRIVLGRLLTNVDAFYGSVQVDELIFFNQALTSGEIDDLYNAF